MSGPMRKNWDETLDAVDDAVESVTRAFTRRRGDESTELRTYSNQLHDKDANLGNGSDSDHTIPDVGKRKGVDRGDGRDDYGQYTRNPDNDVADGDTRPYLDGNRPHLRESTVREVWNKAKGPDGVVRDPNPPYEEIEWDEFSSRVGIWDMGHIPGQKYHDEWLKYKNNPDYTAEDFKEWYNTARHYRPEVPTKNRSHKYE